LKVVLRGVVLAVVMLLVTVLEVELEVKLAGLELAFVTGAADET